MAGLVDRRVGSLDGTPEKRLFLSIMADYDLRTGLCELIDNAIDHWTDNKRPAGLRVRVDLNADRQLISVHDNAGGVREDNLSLLIAPGATRANAGDQFIGIFGVGGKRAGIALGERVEIRTRHGQRDTFGIDVTNDWLKAESWEIDYFKVSNIDPNTTSVSVSHLRKRFLDTDVKELHRHLGETYAWFINQGCAIDLNGRDVKAITFDKWSYPPDFLPSKVQFSIEPAADQRLSVTIEGGLIRDRNPEEENYGVYVYCNERLIVKELRTRDVGYISREAGVPHPDASLCRVIIRMNGSAEAMPWNSSKSGLNLNHPAFEMIRSQVIQLVTHYSTVSRRLKHDWEEAVFQHTRGRVQLREPQEGVAGFRTVLPELPRARGPNYMDQLQSRNARAVATRPWMRGVLDSLGIIELIARSRLETRNRSLLVLLDSNFELALKEYIVSKTDEFSPHIFSDDRLAQLSNDRHALLSVIAPKKPKALTSDKIILCLHYHQLRRSLVGNRITPAISDSEILEYRSLSEGIIKSILSVNIPRT